MQPRIEGVLLETPYEAMILNPLIGQNQGTTPGLISRQEATTAFRRLESSWDKQPLGKERDNMLDLLQQLGITLARHNVLYRPETRALANVQQIDEAITSSIVEFGNEQSAVLNMPQAA